MATVSSPALKTGQSAFGPKPDLAQTSASPFGWATLQLVNRDRLGRVGHKADLLADRAPDPTLLLVSVADIFAFSSVCNHLKAQGPQ